MNQTTKQISALFSISLIVYAVAIGVCIWMNSI